MAVKRSKSGAGCVILFALTFIAMGLCALVGAIREFTLGKTKSGAGLIFFALLSSGVGVGIICLAKFGTRRTQRDEALQATHPDEPWRWREDWARGEVKSAGAPALIFIWCFALFWNAISSAVFFGILNQANRGKVIYIVLIFPLVGAGLLVWAIRQTLRWRRFGESIFNMTTLPGVIGGPFAGVICSARPLHRARQIRLRLACFKRDSSGDSTSEELQWEDEKLFSGEVLQSGDGIPVLFNIPFDCPPTATLSPSLAIVWRLEARALMPGTAYAAQFEVPVFKTAQSRSDATPLPDPAASYEQPSEPAATPGIIIKPSAEGGTEFTFAAARNKSVGLGMILFTAIWTGAIVFMIRMKAPIALTIVFGLFDLLFLWVLISMVTSASRVIVDSNGIQLTTRWLFLHSKKFIPASDVKSIQSKLSMSSGNTSYYDLQAHLEAGKKIGLASHILSKRKADALAVEMERALGKK
jgi:hypothetical protein